ncbi:MAG: hypothetical protein NVS4B10_19450 [Myxococcales bacterium]
MRTRPHFARALTFAAAFASAIAPGGAGCASNADAVCSDIGYCRSQSDDAIKACQAEKKQVASEAASSGCGGSYDAYFACAADKYRCDGNKPGFPGCEGVRASLDACLAQGRTRNACGRLAAAVAQCPGATAPDPSAPPPACGAAEVCAAACYLDAVPRLCAPQQAELAAAARCAQQCPF